MTRGKSERGATAVEYALLAALVAVALVLLMQGVGDVLAGVFDNQADNIGD